MAAAHRAQEKGPTEPQPSRDTAWKDLGAAWGHSKRSPWSQPYADHYEGQPPTRAQGHGQQVSSGLRGRWVDRWIDKWNNGWLMDRQMVCDGQMDERTIEWMDDGWMDRWEVNGWTGE